LLKPGFVDLFIANCIGWFTVSQVSLLILKHKHVAFRFFAVLLKEFAFVLAGRTTWSKLWQLFVAQFVIGALTFG